MKNKIEGRVVDGRYKKNVDKGAMSFLKIPLPIKKEFQNNKNQTNEKAQHSIQKPIERN